MPRRFLLLLVVAIVLLGLAGLAVWGGRTWWEQHAPPQSFGKVVTLAGTGARIGAQSTLSDPFGVAANRNEIYVTDGLGGKVYRVTRQGQITLIADQLEMPSHLAIDLDGSLIVANTGAHTIVRINPRDGTTTVVAGTPHVSGNADGKGTEARFHAPIGVAISKTGLIYVADTYNDRIRTIDRAGIVQTLAGSTQGLQDGTSKEARFDTPSAVAIWNDNELLVADTGNHALRQVKQDGAVTTLTLHDENDGIAAKQFSAPVSLLTYGAPEFYVSDASGQLYFVRMSEQPPQRPPSIEAPPVPPSTVFQVVGKNGAGLIDGTLQGSRLNRPVGIALAGKNTLIVADSGNGLIRAIVPTAANIGTISSPEAGTIKPEVIRKTVPPRWPYDPPEAKREIAGTLGEVRGFRAPDQDAWFHNGLDVPGKYGEPVRAVFNEQVTLPIAVEGIGTLRERLRLPLIGYIHVRIARDQNEKPLGISEAILIRDDKGKVAGVRVPRGTHINAGQIIGTLNSFNHVHLIAGPPAAEVNALAALELPGLVDTVAPTIEAMRLLNEQGEIKSEKNQPLIVKGPIQVVVRAFDQVDGNVGYRKLGVYKIGLQVLDQNGSPLPDYKEPHFNLIFERLPEDQRAVAIAYAEPSQSGYTGHTIFDYLATNVVRDGKAEEGRLDTTKIPNGTYLIRAVVEDFFRNRATKDLKIVIAN